MSEMQQGLVLLDKPPGITSFQALKTIKTGLKTQAVGHTGTLDKFASGLLLVLTGKLTRLSKLFSDMDKTYRVVITFGKATDTLDPEGSVVAEMEVPQLKALEPAIKKLTGPIDQMPPDYSAIHVGGKRAYQIARTGKKPVLKPRKVVIHRIEILNYDPPRLELSVDCSKGTYIRSLARDLALTANSCAFVNQLRRTRVGGFHIEDAIALNAFNPDLDIIPPSRFMKKISSIHSIAIKENILERVRNGYPLKDAFFPESPLSEGLYAVFDRSENLIAIVSKKNGRFHYQAVLLGSKS